MRRRMFCYGRLAGTLERGKLVTTNFESDVGFLLTAVSSVDQPFVSIEIVTNTRTEEAKCSPCLR